MDQNKSLSIAPLILIQTYQMETYSNSRFKSKDKISRNCLMKKQLPYKHTTFRYKNTPRFDAKTLHVSIQRGIHVVCF